MKVALVYDRVNKFGGAERVLLTLHKIFPDAPLYTLVYDKKSAAWAKEIEVFPTFLNYLPYLRKRHEILAPLAPMAFETLDLKDFDVIISITSGDAKSVITNTKQLHICYCLTPNRYFWSGGGEYQKDWKLKILPKWLFNYFRTVDLLISHRPDEYIAISTEVKNRIKKYYNRDSSIIFPAIEDKFYSKSIIPPKSREYYLLVGRLVPYKRAALAIKVFNKLNKRLIVVGEGSERRTLENIANKNIEFVGAVGDAKLIEYYRHAKALIFPQDEDFGLVPLEAQACGTPIIALGKGGVLDTVVDKKTGIFFEAQTEKSLSDAIVKFEKLSFDLEDCRTNAKNFNSEKFSKDFSEKVSSLWRKFVK